MLVKLKSGREVGFVSFRVVLVNWLGVLVVSLLLMDVVSSVWAEALAALWIAWKILYLLSFSQAACSALAAEVEQLDDVVARQLAYVDQLERRGRGRS